MYKSTSLFHTLLLLLIFWGLVSKHRNQFALVSSTSAFPVHFVESVVESVYFLPQMPKIMMIFKGGGCQDPLQPAQQRRFRVLRRRACNMVPESMTKKKKKKKCGKGHTPLKERKRQILLLLLLLLLLLENWFKWGEKTVLEGKYQNTFPPALCL